MSRRNSGSRVDDGAKVAEGSEMDKGGHTGMAKDSWFVRNVGSLKVFMRVVFGIVWFIDGAMKFLPGLPDQFVDMVQSAAQGQPSWLGPWFNFWVNVVTPSPAFWVYFTGVLEVALGLALMLGFMRKLAYLGGIVLSLFIWGVPEGFGGPYGPGSTDIGSAIIYAFVFVLLIIINATFGPSRMSLDYVIEKRYRPWEKVSEFKTTTRSTASSHEHDA